jgi:hypothetical protein
MKTDYRICLLVFAIVYAAHGVAAAAIIEVGDLNIIDDPGNSSDGLRYLDTSYSQGLTASEALISARSTYGNARLASPTEFDDLFAAAGITYSQPTYTASDAFASGPDHYWTSFGDAYDDGVLMA